MLTDLSNLHFKESINFLLIAGPCIIEDEYLSLSIAEKIIEISNKFSVPYIFKGSFKKANRSRIDSFTGIGDIKALKILKKISDNFNVPVTTDIHDVKDADIASEFVDIIQIPAFLVRQTDLLVAAGKTGKYVSLKKGQFMSSDSMKYAIEKVKSTGNNKYFIIERGNMFGYNDLIVDFRNITSMKKYSNVILDVTHSLQKPNNKIGITGGDPSMIETLAKAGIAVGVDGIFIETHFNPFFSKSDGANMLKLDHLENLIQKLILIRRVVV